ncbi:MAG: hypothetical protein DHS20C20_09650 [Ardenticatenaceae bacterium]|nr:MAG: hypothetical protein DHS20C20_09650 [Ardenticatenaceae bacterium]
MAVVQINAQLTPDDILEAVKQFSPSELETFTQQVRLIQAQRKTPHLSRRETELLKQINAGVPDAILRPYQTLKAKLEAETLTEAEQVELTQLVDEMEKFDAERLSWLIELAQLRNQTVPELIETLGLHPQNA